MTKEIKNTIIEAVKIANEQGVFEGYDYLDNTLPYMWEDGKEWKEIASTFYAMTNALGLE